MPWKDIVCPNAPLNVRQEADTLRWNTPTAASDGDLPKKYVVYKFTNAMQAGTHINDGSKVYAVVAGNKLGLPLTDVIGSYFAVTSLDKNNNESILNPGVVLPVTGLQLQLKLEENNVAIKWSTLTEVNTNYFEVQRSNDGRNFITISTAVAAGFSSNKKDYIRYDQLNANGTYFYRIKLYDKDGSTSYSEIGSVRYEMNDKKIFVGPNPFNSQLVIRNANDIRSVDLFDMSGKLILKHTNINRSQIVLKCDDLPSGVYMIRITNANNLISYVKVQKI
jgi:hypothetical protein